MVMVAISCAFMLRAYLEKAATSVADKMPLPAFPEAQLSG